jgi:hypothetical protein
MYYRLFDRQTGCHMATGYNAKTKKDLANSYKSYKSVDFEGDDEDFLESLSVNKTLKMIEEDEFSIETSNMKFSDEENPMNSF